MKIHVRIVILSMFLTLIMACSSSKQDFTGKYGAAGYVNNYDTIWLEKNGVYKRKLIQKSTNQIFTQEGKWRISEWKERNRVNIHLTPFYMNDDIEIIDDTIFRNLSHHGTVLMVQDRIGGMRLLQNGDLGWYYYKIE